MSTPLVEGTSRDRCDVLEERITQTGTMATTKSWVVVSRAVPCRAVELAGVQAYQMSVRGFKKPWILQFHSDPGLTPARNRVRVTDARGAHEIDVRTYRDVGGMGRLWQAEGDEVTTKPAVGGA